MRMHGHTASLEGGKVFLKAGAPWLDEFRGEVLAFPHGRHDDQVDALSQLMTWDADRRTPKAGVYDLRWGARRP
jgi:predicted phage terminase large subunit-like protein